MPTPTKPPAQMPFLVSSVIDSARCRAVATMSDGRIYEADLTYATPLWVLTTGPLPASAFYPYDPNCEGR
jgi:hypothetical protein